MTDIENPPVSSSLPRRRPRLTREKAAALIRHASEQNMSLAACARSLGLSANTLYVWRDKLRTTGKDTSVAQMAPLVKVSGVVESTARPSLVFPCGFRLDNPHLVPESALKSLVEVLSC